MTTYNWEYSRNGNDCLYYYQVETGLIVGQVHNIAHTNVYVAKIYRSHTDEHFLGQFITQDFAKKSVEKYFDIQSRTLLDSDF